MNFGLLFIICGLIISWFLSKKDEQEYKSLCKILDESFDKICYSNSLAKSIDKRKIKYLVHFTDIRNLYSILENGIKPRNSIDNEFFCSDAFRYDNMLNCVSLSIEYPNEKYFWKIRLKNPETVYCVIRLNAKRVLINTENKKYFLYTNASNSAFYNRHKEYSKTNDFEYLFSGKDRYRMAIKHEYLPTALQTEILFEGTVDNYFIDKVFFNSRQDLKKFKKIIPKNEYSIYKDKLSVDSFYFKNRKSVKWNTRK